MHILRGMFLPMSLFGKIPLEKYDKFLISTSGVGEFISFRNYKEGSAASNRFFLSYPQHGNSEKDDRRNKKN